MIEEIIHIVNGSLKDGRIFRERVRNLKDGFYRITIKDARKRSLHQNAYYWGVVVPIVRQGLWDAGYDSVATNNDAHEVLKFFHLKKQFVSKKTGEVVEFGGSTTELDIPGFNSYIENICRWAAEYLGVSIPSPNEQFAEFERWEQELEERCG
jgi:hypothetical protein